MGARRRQQRGFSVVEALVSLFIFLGVMLTVMLIYAPSRLIFKAGELQVEAQQTARVAMAEMARQIRMAGYFPENFTTPAPGTLTADPVPLATDTTLAVHGDVDGAGTSRVHLFCLENGVLRNGVDAKDQSAAYTCSSGDVLAEKVSSLRFTYYDAAGDPLPDPPAGPYQLDGQSPGAVPDLADTSQRQSIRRVVVTLTLEVEAPHKEVQTFTLASDVWLRNVS